MKSSVLRVFCILTSLLIVATQLSGCGGNNPSESAKYDLEQPAESLTSGIVAQNKDYELSWDEENKCVLFKCNSDGKIWSNVPYEHLASGQTNVFLNSTINITVADTSTMEWSLVRGQIGVNNSGRLFCEKTDGGLKITYCFDQYEILIPVTYVLRDDSLLVSIDGSEIIEGTSLYRLVSVSLAPYLCSSANTTDGAYLFVPSGCGALMYTSENADVERVYSAEVYSKDVSRVIPEEFTEDEAVRLPVFGVDAGESALFAVMEQGAASAFIEAETGNKRVGYSSVYPTFYFRGYDIIKEKSSNNADVTLTSDDLSDQTVSVGYYPLTGDKADINGMAECYQKYLDDTNAFTDSATARDPYSVTVLGGAQITKSVMGIPYKSMKAMTTFEQAQKITEELISLTGAKPTVRLMGFGESGISPGNVAGGYGFASNLGNEQERKSLEAFCVEQKISLFTDFDMICYTKSGDGFSYKRDAAKTAVNYSATKYTVNTPLRDYDTDSATHILGRKLIDCAIDKLINTFDKDNLSGISLSSLSNTAYSDYSDKAYYTKGGIESDVIRQFQKLKEAGHAAAASQANAYAACAADVLFDISAGNGGYDALDETVPFYQMVYSGKKAMYSQAVNLAENAKEQIMLAAAYGMGLGFTLIYDYDVALQEIKSEKLYGMLYSGNKENIADALNTYSKVYDAVKDCGIECYELLGNGISKTVFENGTVLYANHTDRTTDSPIGKLEAYGFALSS